MDGPNLQFESILEDQDLVDAICAQAARGALTLPPGSRLSPEIFNQALESRLEGGRARTAESLTAHDDELEAIVCMVGRPSLLVQGGTLDPASGGTWKHALQERLPHVEAAVARVGRIELIDHPDLDWVGTGWVVERNIIVTNRHVAARFAEDRGGTLAFAANWLGGTIGAALDLGREHGGPAGPTFRVERVLYLAWPQDPDVALLEVRGDAPLPAPLPLAERGVVRREPIGVVGYPAHDSRSDGWAMRRYFGEVFDVKRFAPGKVQAVHPKAHFFAHDCTTLGGSSGSEIVNLEDGTVVGLHFSGRYRKGNFAVKTEHIKAALAAAAPTAVAMPPVAMAEPPEDGPVVDADELKE